MVLSPLTLTLSPKGRGQIRIDNSQGIKRRIFMKRCSSILTISVSVMLWLLAGVAVAAEKYPSRPINLIVGFSPGGASDLGSKVLADKMAEFLGQPLVSIYKPGGGGALAASFLAKAKPDGYNVLVMASFMNLPPEIKKLDYKLDDFILTGIYSRAPYFVIVKADARWKNFQELAAEAKESPGKLSYGTAGVNTGGHFVHDLMAKNSGVIINHVPFKSCPDAFTAMLGGHIDVYICVGAGASFEPRAVRVLATAESKRLEGLPNVPTLTELGYPAFFTTWYSFAVPKGTPPPIVEALTEAQGKALEKYGKEIEEGLRRVEMWPMFLDRQRSLQEFKTQYDTLRELAGPTGPGGK
jgi:tripartite-type tricarboxylate transporter receptor subunit TctC